MAGGDDTYAEFPLSSWMQDFFDLNRTHYDRLGHFAQECIQAIFRKEILLRRSLLGPGKRTFFLISSMSLAFSASYKMFD